MRRPSLIFLCAFLGACSSSDFVVKPAELTAIDATLPVSREWGEDTGAGNGGRYILLAPLVQSDRLVITDIRGNVSAYDRETGKRLWNRDLDLNITAGVGGGLGVALVGSGEGDLIALDTDTGAEKWRRKMSGQVLALSDADGGLVVVRLTGGKVNGVSLEDGSVAWEFGREEPSLALHGQGKPLTAHGGVALGLDDGTVVMLQLKTGTPIWEAVVAAGRGRTELERLVDVDGTMVLSGDLLFAVSYQGQLTAIDARSGSIVWSRDASSNTGVAVDDKAVYFTDDASIVRAVSRNSGLELWSQSGLENRRVTRPTLSGNAVVVADYDGYLHWLDRSTGKFVQRQRAASSGILLPPVALGGQLATLADDGDLRVWSTGTGN